VYRIIGNNSGKKKEYFSRKLMFTFKRIALCVYLCIEIHSSIVRLYYIIISCRRPEVGETVLLQRPASRAHHAVLQDYASVCPVPGTRCHHNSCVHANGITVVGLTRSRKRAGQQRCEFDEKQKKSTCPMH